MREISLKNEKYFLKKKKILHCALENRHLKDKFKLNSERFPAAFSEVSKNP